MSDWKGRGVKIGMNKSQRSGPTVLVGGLSRTLTMSQEMHHGGSVVVKEVPVIKEVIKEVRVEVPKVVYVPVEVIKEVREAEGTA